jgi:hypothetical protein
MQKNPGPNRKVHPRQVGGFSKRAKKKKKKKRERELGWIKGGVLGWIIFYS